MVGVVRGDELRIALAVDVPFGVDVLALRLPARRGGISRDTASLDGLALTEAVRNGVDVARVCV